MALNLYRVEKWLVGQCSDHMGHANLSTVTDPAVPSVVLAIPIGNALRRIGFPPGDPTAVTAGDLALVPWSFETVFYQAALIALKKRILNFYQSQQTQGVLSARHEFGNRADRLREEIAEDEVELKRLFQLMVPSVGSPLSESTNVPDAITLPYHL